MNTTNSIYTRQRKGIDNSVWISMFTCIVLSVGLLGYKVTKRNVQRACQPIEILVNGSAEPQNLILNPGDVLTFHPSVSSGDQIIWDFGDKTKTQEGFTAVHVFMKEGPYRIRALVNNQCWFQKQVTISQKEAALLDSMGAAMEAISGTDQAMAGNKLVFSTSLTASRYEWKIENNGNFPVQTGREASFKFNTEGQYTVLLMLDGNRNTVFRKPVYVTKGLVADGPVRPLIPNPGKLIPAADSVPAPKPAEPEKPAAVAEQRKKKFLSDNLFKEYLQMVVCGGFSASDFNEFLCDGEKTRVLINNESRKSFKDFCAEIMDKKARIESVVAARDENECVVNLTVKYVSKKGFLGWGKGPCK